MGRWNKSLESLLLSKPSSSSSAHEADYSHFPASLAGLPGDLEMQLMCTIPAVGSWSDRAHVPEPWCTGKPSTITLVQLCSAKKHTCTVPFASAPDCILMAELKAKAFTEGYKLSGIDRTMGVTKNYMGSPWQSPCTFIGMRIWLPTQPSSPPSDSCGGREKLWLSLDPASFFIPQHPPCQARSRQIYLLSTPPHLSCPQHSRTRYSVGSSCLLEKALDSPQCLFPYLPCMHTQ